MRRRALLVSVLIVAALLGAWLLGRIGYRPLDWQIYTDAAGSLLAGQSPYQGTLYFGPPWVALLLVPLSLLPPSLSSGAWLLALLGAVLALSAHWTKLVKFPERQSARLATAAVAVISPAALYVYLTGQVTALVGLALTYLAFWRHGRWRAALAATAAFLVASAKPQVIAFPLLLVLLNDLRRRRWRRPLVGLGTLTTAAVISFLIRPSWPKEWWEALRGAAYLGGANSYSVGYIGLREMGISGFVLALPLLYSVVYWWRCGSTPRAVALALASGLLWLPYTRIYDQILLLPAALSAADAWRESGARGMSTVPLLAFGVLPLTDFSLVLSAVLLALLLARSSISEPAELAPA